MLKFTALLILATFAAVAQQPAPSSPRTVVADTLLDLSCQPFVGSINLTLNNSPYFFARKISATAGAFSVPLYPGTYFVHMVSTTFGIARDEAWTVPQSDVTLRLVDVGSASANIACTAAGGPPSGPAGGVLSGTFPNPGCVAATSLVSGCLSAADWSTFNAKQVTLPITDDLTNLIVNGRNLVIGSTVLGPKTIGAGANQLPAASTCTRCMTMVTDASSASDCTAGSGTAIAVCYSNGSVWGPVVGSSATQIAAALACRSASGSATDYTCPTVVAATCTTGLQVLWTPDVTNAGGTTLNVGCGVKAVHNHENGAATANLFTLSIPQLLTYDGTEWLAQAIVPTAVGWTSTGSGTIGGTLLDPVTGITDSVPALLPKWRAALASQRAGIADAKVLFIGDSTTQGFGVGTPHIATVPNWDSYPWQLTTLLKNRGVAAQPGLVIGCDGYAVEVDTRWTVAGNWSCFPFSNGFTRSSWIATTFVGNLVFTPGASVSYDSFDVYYICAPGFGSLAITATGGSTVNVNTSSCGFSGVGKTTVMALIAATTNAVTITASGATVLVSAVEPWLATAKYVRIGNAGVAGTNTNMWLDTPIYGGPAAITAYAPNLTVISLGINDSTIANSVTISNITSLITTAKASGDVILMTWPPSSNSTTNGNLTALHPLFQALARSQGVPLIDMWGRFNGVYATAFMSDAVHPNITGYWDWAGLIDVFLKRID